ncbi:MAG: hypothetical protein KAV87_10680 [Desulfobacteraceae bacterium]|nr:hypothetical protein [Desulfobacteraceae bacterium]
MNVLRKIYLGIFPGGIDLKRDVVRYKWFEVPNLVRSPFGRRQLWHGPIKRALVFLDYRLGIMRLSFYIHAWQWHRRHRKQKKNSYSVDELFEIFYIDFLAIPRDQIKIIWKTDTSIFTKCYHECPILGMALLLEKNTREVCRRTSKGPCDYFIRRLSHRIIVENEYYEIRPHVPGCTETLTIPDEWVCQF